MGGEHVTREEKILLAKAIMVKEEQKRRQLEYRNQIYDLMYRFNGRYVVLIGGSGSGKSYEIASLLCERMCKESKARFLALRAESKQYRNSVFPLLKSRRYTIKDDNKWGTKESIGDEKVFRSDTESETIFSGLDNVEKLKSIFDIASVFVEEADQALEADINELDRRLRGYKQGKMQIYLAFNPVSVLSWINTKYFKSMYQECKLLIDGKEVTKTIRRTIAVRGTRPFNDFPYYKDAYYTDYELSEKITIWSDELNKWVEEYRYNTLIIHSTYLDNKFIDDDYYKVMEKLKQDDPEEYNVYALGQWGVIGGSFFDKKNVNNRIMNAAPPIRRGYFEFDYQNHEIVTSSIKFIDDDDGCIKIYKEPQKGYPYVFGGDTAGDGSDWNTGTMTDNTTETDVATIRLNYDEDLYARQVYCLGMYYNKALVALESNFSTHPNKELERWGYPNLYVREQSPDAFTGKLTNKYGFNTNQSTRPTMLSMLRTIMREEPHKVVDLDTLNEMITFVKNEKGRPEAANGHHDDMIMARAINCYVASQQSKEVTIEEAFNIDQLPEDLQEDYYNAPDNYRKQLLKQWGY